MPRGQYLATHDWIGTNFLSLWRDSFQPGRHNYLSELLGHLERDRNIPEFQYQIRRPSGALAEYSSSYYWAEDFLGGGPVRVAVSVSGAWHIVDGAPDGSE